MKMLPFDEALKIVLDSAKKLGCERVDINQAANRILAEDVESDMDMPPRNRSVFDGYACRRQDLANELKVIETIPAGMPPKKTIGPNQCAKIMTGATVPKGADCVFMVELSENPNAGTVRFTGEKTETRRQRSDDRGPKAEVGMRKSEFFDCAFRISDCGLQLQDGRGQRSCRMEPGA